MLHVGGIRTNNNNTNNNNNNNNNHDTDSNNNNNNNGKRDNNSSNNNDSMVAWLRERRRGRPRARTSELKFKLGQLRPFWSAPRLMPAGSGTVQSIAMISKSAFCLLRSGGRADAFCCDSETLPDNRRTNSRRRGGINNNNNSNNNNNTNSSSNSRRSNSLGNIAALENSLDGSAERAVERHISWLTDLSVYEGEYVRMVAHLQSSQSILTAYTIPDELYRGFLFLRILDANAVLKGDLQTRSCGDLSELVIPAGGFVEYDTVNSCVWVNDRTTLRTWDATTFEQRLSVNLESFEDFNVRFTWGAWGILWPGPVAGELMFRLYSAKDGALQVDRKVSGGTTSTDGHSPAGQPTQNPVSFLELVGNLLLFKRSEQEATVINLRTGDQSVIEGSRSWEPDLFFLVPKRKLVLALSGTTLEVWRLWNAPSCVKLGAIEGLERCSSKRIWLDQDKCLSLLFSSKPDVKLDDVEEEELDRPECQGLSTLDRPAAVLDQQVRLTWSGSLLPARPATRRATRRVTDVPRHSHLSQSPPPLPPPPPTTTTTPDGFSSQSVDEALLAASSASLASILSEGAHGDRMLSPFAAATSSAASAAAAAAA
eukprot:CAMPEP_0206438852 /NCGR_PEP_ID=MMETSP0324_2-20121206/11876_1 /ASSEMBLY_ACC=CAM_ASM_000836 /TAXON_ID=2866 /ORGANISM="Crypthecodinium cohnii, Strain Seligo" /LENGTH=596 /DNA_ID=CAMNT_0053906389 /DNA_START=12 /DNA_END=1798 /DNA_ORIENTATION=+